MHFIGNIIKSFPPPSVPRPSELISQILSSHGPSRMRSKLMQVIPMAEAMAKERRAPSASAFFILLRQII